MENGNTPSNTVKPLKFVVGENCAISDVGKNNKPYRKQRVMVHHGEEITKLEYMLDKDEPFLVPGEYRLAPDAVYLGQSTREYNGRTYTEPALRVSPRFVKVPVSVPKAA